ncbi:hypothetical protein D3C71_1260980 [compost metagenome]
MFDIAAICWSNAIVSDSGRLAIATPAISPPPIAASPLPHSLGVFSSRISRCSNLTLRWAASAARASSRPETLPDSSRRLYAIAVCTISRCSDFSERMPSADLAACIRSASRSIWDEALRDDAVCC